MFVEDLKMLHLPLFLIVIHCLQVYTAPLCPICPPGQGISALCESGEAKCVTCPTGTFSSTFDDKLCELCSKCGPELYELRVCNSTSDTFCELCSWHESPKSNPDYKLKCVRRSNPSLARKGNHYRETQKKSSKSPRVRRMPHLPPLPSDSDDYVAGNLRPAPVANFSFIFKNDPKKVTETNNTIQNTTITDVEVSGSNVTTSPETFPENEPVGVPRAEPLIGKPPQEENLEGQKEDNKKDTLVPKNSTRTDPPIKTGDSDRNIEESQKKDSEIILEISTKKPVDAKKSKEPNKPIPDQSVHEKFKEKLQADRPVDDNSQNEKQKENEFIGGGIVKPEKEPEKESGKTELKQEDNSKKEDGKTDNQGQDRKEIDTDKPADPLIEGIIIDPGVPIGGEESSKVKEKLDDTKILLSTERSINMDLKHNGDLEENFGTTASGKVIFDGSKNLTDIGNTEDDIHSEKDILPESELQDPLIQNSPPQKRSHGQQSVEVKVEVGESKDSEERLESVWDSVSPLALTMSVVTTGLIFFFIGFCYNRKSTDYQQQPFHNTPRPSPILPRRLPISRMVPPTPPPIVKVTTDEDQMTFDEEESVALLYNRNRKPSMENSVHLVEQSPVDIVSQDVMTDLDLEISPLRFYYVPENAKYIMNTGSTIKLVMDYHGSRLTGGPLEKRNYRLDHITFHWGDTIDRGSEHSLEGRKYPAECHFIHWNEEDYKSYEEACRFEHGLAVIAVFLQVDGKLISGHPGLETITEHVSEVLYKGQKIKVPGGKFDPASLFPENQSDYWTYEGSLTSMPYYETVTWVIFRDPVIISNSQIERFRQLNRYEKGTEDHERLVNNYRSLQPLGHRHIRCNFDPE